MRADWHRAISALPALCCGAARAYPPVPRGAARRDQSAATGHQCTTAHQLFAVTNARQRRATPRRTRARNVRGAAVALCAPVRHIFHQTVSGGCCTRVIARWHARRHAHERWYRPGSPGGRSIAWTRNLIREGDLTARGPAAAANRKLRRPDSICSWDGDGKALRWNGKIPSGSWRVLYFFPEWV
jgi:hypothetical protein